MSAVILLRKSVGVRQNVGQLRRLWTTPSVQDVFNVQDEEDFKVRVLQSTKPTVVDFHAK